jgi:hypothetical protein
LEKIINEGDKIYAFKPQADRFLCFFYEGKKLSSRMVLGKNNKSCPLKKKKTL